MHSLSSPHAMTWHRVCPFEPRLQIASHLCKMRIRQELDLPMPHRRAQQPASRALLQPASRGPRTPSRFQSPDLRPYQQRRWQPTQNARQGKIRRSGGLQLGGLTTRSPSPSARYQAPRTGTATPTACDQTSESTACETPASQSSQTSPSPTSWTRQPTTRANHDPAKATRPPTATPS